MAGEPYISGNDILSYRGDPGLAYGSGQVPYDLNPANMQPLAGMETTLGRLQDHDAQVNLIEYQKKLQDQQALAEMLAQTGGSAFNMKGDNGQNVSFTPLPDDKKILDQKADDIRSAILANPSGFKYDQDILRKQKELQYLSSHAGQRAVFYARANAEASQENDPEERQAILDNRDRNIAAPLTDFAPLDPHLKKLSWSSNTFYDPKMLTDKDAQNTYSVDTYDKNGNLMKKEGIGLNDSNFDFRSKVRPTNEKVWAESNNMANSFFSSPLAKDPNAINALNREVDAINAQRGYVDADGNPVSVHAIPHIADVMQDGSIRYNTRNPADISYALLAKTYGAVTPKEAIQKDKIDIEKTQEEEKAKEAQIAHAKVQEAQEWERLRLQKMKDAQDPKLSKDERDQARIEADGLQSNIQVYKQFQQWNKNGKKIPDNIVGLFSQSLSDLGVDVNKYEVKSIPSDAMVKKLVSEPGTDVFSKATGRLKDMDKAYVLVSKNGDPKDDILVGQFKDKANPTATLRIIPTQVAVENNIASRTGGAKPTTRQIATIEAAQNHYSKEDGIWSNKYPSYKEPDKTTQPTITTKTVQALGGQPEASKFVNGKWYHKRGTLIVDDNGVPYQPKK